MLVLVGDLALHSALAQQLDARVEVKQISVRHRSAVLERRLTVGPERSREVTCCDGELDDGGAVTGEVSVLGQAREGPRRQGQPSEPVEHLPVQRPESSRRDAGQDCLADDLVAARGAVVALTDAGVTRPYTNHVAYLTAKGALQAGLRAMSVELAPEVRVNMVALGIVADPEADADPLRMHRLATRSPLGRFGSAEEVIHVVLSLLDSTWATGEIWGVGR